MDLTAGGGVDTLQRKLPAPPRPLQAPPSQFLRWKRSHFVQTQTPSPWEGNAW